MLSLLIFIQCVLHVWSGVPIPKFSYQIVNVPSTIYRYSLEIPQDTFIDAEDGNTQKLQIQWLFINNQTVPNTYWIVLRRSPNKDELILYVDRNVWQNQYYYFNLKAIDKDGNYAVMLYNFTFLSPPQDPIYKRFLILESNSSDIFQSSSVEILFYIQEKKIYPYSQLNQQGVPSFDQIVTDTLNLTKTNGLTTIYLTWSSSIFFLNWCDLNKIINFRSKTIKMYNLTYLQYFNPEFFVKQSTESFYGACSYLSIDPPLVSSYVFNSIQIDTGVYFSIALPHGLFFPPETGKLMSILLDLRTSSGEKLPSSYWITLNGNNISNNKTLDGFVSYNQALQQSSYIFQLVASTPLLEESYRILNISINSFPIIQQNFIVSFKGFVAFSTSYLNFITRFISIMSNYLSISSSIIIFDVNTPSDQTVVTWSLLDFTLQSCNISELSLLKFKLVDENGLPTNGLKDVLNMSINYLVSNITFSAQLACLTDQNGPVRNEVYLNISVKDGLYRFILPLPSTTFIDAKDGDMSKLVLQLLLPNGENVPLSNWVQLLRSNNKDQLIGFLSLETYSKKSWSFLLKATDSDGNYATKSYNFFIDTQPLSLYYQISLTLQTSVAEVVSLNDVELAFYIQEKKILPYSQLENQGIFDVNTLIVLSLNVKRDFNVTSASFVWSSSIFSFSSCDVNKMIRFRSKVFDNFNAVYNSFFKPEITITSKFESFIGNCSYLSSDPPLVGNPAFIKVEVEFGLLFSINIPNDIFIPPVNGSSMKLNIYLTGVDGEDLSFLNWINLNDNTLTNNISFVGYASNDVAAIQTIYRFRLVAYTPLLVNASRLLIVNITNYYQVKENFVVTLSLTSYNIIAYYTFINLFLSTISNYLSYPVDSILVLKSTFISNNVVIRWTLKEYSATECNLTELNRITNKLVYKDGKATLNFTSTLSNITVNLSLINIENLGVCAANKNFPVPDEPLLNINVSNNVNRFNLLLNRTTFVDSKDGDMSNLKIDLLFENGEPVSLSNWVQVSRSNENDSLIGYIPLNVYNKLIWKFILKATNSDGNFATKLYIFNLESSPKQATYKMHLTLRSNYQNFVNSNDVLILFYILDFKLMNYSQRNFQGISDVYSFITEDVKIFRNISEILITLLWSTDEFTTSYCQLEKIVQLRNKSTGKYYTKYSNMFLPEFNLISNTESFFDACSYLSADPPILGAQQFQKLYVASGSLFSITIPDDLFRPPLNGSTMTLNIELRNQKGEAVLVPWVALNGNIFRYGLKIEGYIPFDIAFGNSSFLFQLVAITPLREEISHFFNIIILDDKTTLQLNYVVTFSSQSYTVGNYNFVSNFMSQLSSYLSVRMSSILIIKFVTTTSSTDIQWTLLSLTGTCCNDVLVQAINSKVISNGTSNPNLDFVLNSINFVNTTIVYNLGFACNNDNTPPVPDVDTEDVMIQSNVYRFRLTLPLTTFVDKSDGNINFLKIDFMTKNKTTVPVNNWIQLQKTNNSYEYIGYVNILLSSTNIWTYFIKATDKTGNAAFKKYKFFMVEKQTQANYRKNLTIYSFLPSLYQMTDVEILFYIQEQKLYPYSLQQNQGITDVNTLITEELQVTRRGSFVEIYLVWTSAIFIASSCDIQKLINCRSKTLSNYTQIYSNFFLPEFTFISETEEFLDACKFLTSKPPVVGPSNFSDILLKVGEFFSIVLPNNLFIAPSIATSLSVYLQDENGNALPNFSWITLKNSNFASNLRIEGYVSIEMATRNTNYLFRLVAVTSLQVEAYRLINITITEYKPIQQNFVITFMTSSTKIPYTTFVNRFIVTISKYLSLSVSSILIISYDTNSTLTKVKWTLVQLTGASCDSLLASSISLKILDSNSTINPYLLDVLANISIALMSADISKSDKCTVDRNGPIPDQFSKVITIDTNVYRFSFILPVTTFVDVKDGDMTKLFIELTTENGYSLSVESWIELVQSSNSFRLNGFVSSVTYTEPKWIFLLKATDSDKNVGTKKYIFIVNPPPLGPSYIKSLTLSTISPSIFGLNDVSILFYIQEKKLIPYAIGNSQGFTDINALVTRNLIVERTDSYITVKLLWSSNVFVSNQCPVQKIIDVRSKTTGAYSAIYSQSFQPEFMLIEENESLHGPCIDLSINPPLIGPVILNTIGVKFGELFSINLPNSLFIAPSVGTKLSIYLSDENGNALPEFYWIRLSSNNLDFGLRLEGYASNKIAVQKTRYQFRFVAVTQLQTESYSVINVIIQGYKLIQKNFLITLSTFSRVNIDTVFINQFVLTVANYLSFSASSVLIINYDTSSLLTKIEWTLVQFASISCDRNLASSISSKLLGTNGKVNADFSNALANINFVLSSVDIFLSDICAINSNGPVPDQPLQTYLINTNVYRFSYNLPITTFVDAKDGDMSKLIIELTTESGISVPVNSWIELVQSGSRFLLNGFVCNTTYNKAQWIFILKATDSDKNVGFKKYIFNVKFPLLGPNYIKDLVLRSFSSAILSMSDVSLLFYIQEKKLIPYAIGQSQGFTEVESLITNSFLVQRTDSFITVNMVWSSNIFVSEECSLQKIISVRSKTTGSYSSTYSKVFQPEFMYVLEKELFFGPCGVLSIDPPTIGPGTLNTIRVKFGEFFTVILPKNLFTPPTIGTSLSFYLRDENGNVLPDFYWIKLNSNNLDIGLKIEGYASNVIAVQRTSYLFRLIATTSLKIEAYRFIHISIIGYIPIQQQLVVTFTTLSTITSCTTFVNQFILTISKYLSFSASSIVIINYDTISSLTKIQWTTVHFTGDSCDSLFASSISLKLLDENGKVKQDFFKALLNINIILTSANISISDNCAIDRNSFVPLQPLRN